MSDYPGTVNRELQGISAPAKIVGEGYHAANATLTPSMIRLFVATLLRTQST